jgi:hypothetical protein
MPACAVCATENPDVARFCLACGAPLSAEPRREAARALVEEGRRAEADVQLQRGLAFFRAVGATQVVLQAEALLAAAS